MRSDDSRHVSVLQTTVLAILRPQPGDRVLDCTLGLGGHSAAFLEAIGPTGSLVALDADADNLRAARERLAPYGDRADLRHLNFRHAATLTGRFDVILADLGLSSPHLDDAERGFSFRADAPLDMRFDRTAGETAARFLAERDEEEIADALWRYGEIRESRRLARFIKELPPATTLQLADRIERAVGGKRAHDLLPRAFQALRIAVNDEMGALESLLSAIPTLLAPGGRAGIISFHSLEDRLVKQTFRDLTTPEKDPVTGRVSVPAAFEPLTKKAVAPDADELAINPRSRSAKFRAIRLLPPL